MGLKRAIVILCILQISYHSTESAEGNTIKHYRSDKYHAQVIFDGNKNVINCQWTENGDNSTTRNVDAELVTDAQMEGFIRSCKVLKKGLWGPQNLIGGDILIAIGTNWCGAGNKAEDYDDLGERPETDSCCRAHDHCDLSIGAMEREHGLFNFAIFARSGCHCEEEFFACLKNATNSESLAAMVGILYFNIINMDCIKEVPKTKCVRRLFGFCIEREEVPGETKYVFVKEDMNWFKNVNSLRRNPFSNRQNDNVPESIDIE